MNLAPLKGDLWKLGSSLDQLSHTMIYIRDSHAIADIITTVDNDIPIDTEFAKTEAD